MAAPPLIFWQRMRMRFDFIMGKRVRQLYSCNNEIGSSPRFSACIFSLRHKNLYYYRKQSHDNTRSNPQQFLNFGG